MSEDNTSWTDRLRDRGFIDQWGFAFFAGLGSVGIFAAKYFEIDALWVVIGAISAMLAYAFLIARKGGGRLAADQSGDNCYYLGLIYTLTSLSFAIIFFDASDATATIIQGFGVALGTTIAGLILRVFFNQGRPDLENVEEQARLELTEAASQLTVELSQSATIMKDFARQITQSLGEVRDEAAKQLKEFIDNATTEMRLVVDTANEAIKAQANDFASRSKRYTTSFDGLLGKLDEHADKVVTLSQGYEALTLSTEAIRTTADAVKDGVASLGASAVVTRSNVEDARASSEEARQLMSGLAQQLTSLQNAVTSFQTQANEKLAQLETAPGETVTAAARSISEAARTLEEQLNRLARTHDAVAKSIDAQAQSSLALVERNNQEIDGQLERSRQLYGRVFDGLASITDDLARRAETGR